MRIRKAGRNFLCARFGYIRVESEEKGKCKQYYDIQALHSSQHRYSQTSEQHHFSKSTQDIDIEVLFKMNNIDSHPRVLSLSSPSATSSPLTSGPATPAEQSRRPSHESAHDAHHFINMEEKTHRTLNGSIKKMWKDLKQHAVEHHRSVNAAYQAQWGAAAGVRVDREM